MVRAVAGSEFPELTDLELYLGTSEYFGGSEVADLAGILEGTAFPKLRYLGLRNAENSDEIAAAVAHAPVVARLEVLDLSLGSLGDEGAAALLAGQPLTHLKKLDLHHHFISEPMQDRLRRPCPAWKWICGRAGAGPGGTARRTGSSRSPSSTAWNSPSR